MYKTLLMATGLLLAPAVDTSETPVSTANTQGTVTFVTNTDEVDPDNPQVIDPSNPDNGFITPPDDSEGIGGTGTESFRISWVSHFNFGEVPITGLKQDIFAKPSKFNGKELAPFIQVVDTRGTGDKWELKAKATPFKYQGDTGDIIKGASLHLQNGIILNSLDPLGETTPYSKTVDGQVNLSEGEAVVMKADQGQGVWSLMFGADETGVLQEDKGVMLSIPRNTQIKKGAYQTDITWILSSNPKGDESDQNTDDQNVGDDQNTDDQNVDDDQN